MKGLILAAGYGTRLYPLTKDCAKPLLPVGGRPIIDYIVDKLDAVADLDHIHVVTNHKFAASFEQWAARRQGPKPITVFDDRTRSDDDKLGAIGDISFVLNETGLDDELLVVGGDNLFDDSLQNLVALYRDKGTAVGLYAVEDLEAIKRYNEIRLDDEDRVVSFREKPPDPVSNLFAICLYAFSPEAVGLIERYLGSGSNPDAPGYYIQWLYQQIPVYGYRLRGRWFDIGNLEVYREADRVYGQRQHGGGGGPDTHGV